ncbi:MAG: hypothetical protein ABR555_08885 [Pyrinomonadaceae bacterium]
MNVFIQPSLSNGSILGHYHFKFNRRSTVNAGQLKESLRLNSGPSELEVKKAILLAAKAMLHGPGPGALFPWSLINAPDLVHGKIPPRL